LLWTTCIPAPSSFGVASSSFWSRRLGNPFVPIRREKWTAMAPESLAVGEPSSGWSSGWRWSALAGASVG
jgi:hypothetical protein